MNVEKLILGSLPKTAAGHALLIGTFDGFHLGHQSLLVEARKDTTNVSVLLIYSTNKATATKEHQKSGMLTSIEERISIFAKIGFNNVFLLNLSDNFISLSKEDFITQVLNELEISKVVIGEDFRFGAKASGTPEFLSKTSLKNFTVTILKPLVYKGEKISTTLVKKLLSEGKTSEAKMVLGHSYSLTGFVVKGFGLGGKLGFPTANIALDPLLFLPRHGVYLVGIKHQDKKYFGMASLGYHPTVNEVSSPLLEVNVFNFEANLYHEVVTVCFLEHLRDEVKLSSIEELIQLISKDKKKCNTLIKEKRYEDECL